MFEKNAIMLTKKGNFEGELIFQDDDTVPVARVLPSGENTQRNPYLSWALKCCHSSRLAS